MADDPNLPQVSDVKALADALALVTKQSRDMAKATGDTFNYLKQAVENAEALAAAAQKNIDLAKEGADANRRRLKDVQDELGFLEAKKDIGADLTNDQIKEKLALEEKAAILQEFVNLTDAQRVAIQKQNEEYVKQERILKKINDQNDQVNRSVKAAGGHLLSMVSMGKEFEKTLLGGVAMGLGKLVGGLNEAKLNFKDMAEQGLSRFAGGFATWTYELTGQMDALTAGTVKSTGANSDFVDTLSDSATELRGMGLGIDTASTAFNALYKNTTDFRNMTASAQQELTVFVATLERAGVGSAQTSAVFQSLSRTLNLGTAQAKEMTGEFVDFAKALNMDVNKFLGDTAQALEALASRGAQATNIVKDLGIMSEQTGVSMNKLVAVAKKFDTFAGAAESVGRLNGILGGAYLNSIDMVYATESERMELLHQTIELSGKSFEAMGHHEKQALATAAGFNNVADAAQFFNQSMHVNRAEMEAAAEQQERHADLARRSMSIFEELKMTMMSFAISFEGFFTVISGILAGFATFNAALGGWPGKIMGVAAALMMVIKFMKALRTAAAFMIPMTAKNIAALEAEGVAVALLTSEYHMLNAARMGGSGGFIGPRRPAGGGGFMGKVGGLGKWAMRGAGAIGGGALLHHGIKEDSTGSMIAGGAALGATIGSVIPGVGTFIGAGVGAAAGWIGSLFENGTDNTPAVPAIGVNEGLGGEIIAAPPASSVINNRNIQGLTAGMLALNRNMMTQGPASGRQLANAVAQGMKQANKSDSLHNRGQIAVIDTQEKIISIDVPRDFRRA